MNVLESIALLRHDLDRCIEFLESLRNGFATYAAVAPDLDKPSLALRAAKGDPRLKEFIASCRTAEGAYVRVRDLWHTYVRWCRLNQAARLAPAQFAARLRALGYEYSRSRRIRGRQVRTWEGIAVRKAN